MTFDLHYSNKNKAAAYKMWVRRIYTVAATLQLSYLELWELPEQEFLILEEISEEVRKKQEQAKQDLLAQQEARQGARNGN